MAKKLGCPATGALRAWFDWLPGDYCPEVNQDAGLTPGLKRLGSSVLSKLDVIGFVDKHSLVKPKKKEDLNFRQYYSGLGHRVEDIPDWRNARFTGVEGYTAFAKYAHDEPQLTTEQEEAFYMAVRWMETEFRPYVEGSHVLSQQTVMDSTESGRSPGYPWNKYFESCARFYDSCDSYILEEYWDRSISRDHSLTIWNSFLKEELRRIHKIEAGDIRQINGCSVEFKVAMNRYCLDFNNKFYSSHLKTASAVGMNKYHGGWQRLFDLLRVHAQGFALDVKRWDSHFPRRLMEAIRDFRWDSFSVEYKTRSNHRRFVNYYEQIIESVTVMNWGELLRTRLGNPSGSPNTVVDNTLGLYVLVAYSFIRSAMARGEPPTYGQFSDQIALVLYGDDNTFSGSPHGLEILNYETMHQYGAELGFEVTSGESPLPRPVAELDFLSGVFHETAAGMMVYKPKHSRKCLASLAFRGDDDILKTWSRACALRQNSFFDKPMFELIDGFCKWLMHRIDRRAESEGWQGQWKGWKSQYLPERDLWELHCSCE